MVKDTLNNQQSGPPHLPWAGKKVHTDAVEEELALLWRMSADNLRTSQNLNVRTSVLNLVICAPDVAAAQRASALIRDLSSTHIARITIIILDNANTASTPISTWVTLRSFSIISDMMRHSFEQITLMVSGSAVHSLASIVHPLLKPDLPVYLWWLNDPPEDHTLFSNLVNLSSRVIVDSNSFFKPEESIAALFSFMEASPRCAFSDLNWGRITPWRELVAQFFDMAEYKPYLAGVNHIEIEHAVVSLSAHTRTALGDVSPNPVRALLLAAWLKTSLGWSLSSDYKQNSHDPSTGTHSWTMGRATGPLVGQPVGSAKTTKLGTIPHGSLYIRPKMQEHMRPGSVCLVRLISDIENKHATFQILSEDDPDHVSTSVELEQGIQVPSRAVSIAATHKESDLLHDELEIMGRDHLYEQTLREAFNLLE